LPPVRRKREIKNPKLVADAGEADIEFPMLSDQLITPPRRNSQSRAPYRRRRGWRLLVWITVLAGMSGACADELRPYMIEGDAIAQSLTGARGDPAKGRALVVSRQGTCLLCHSGPFPEEKFQGDLSPSLAGAGSRWSEGQLRLRIVDASKLNADTIMPSYYRTEGLARVAAAFRGRPIFTAEQVEDVVAFLKTLRDEPR
jgi:sulfur-oxidizing protein SoxX